MNKILLTQGQSALVNDSDFEWLSQYKWQASWAVTSRQFNARRIQHVNGRVITIYMHRQIMNAGSGVEVDHINMNKLDNRRANLRICSGAENRQHRNRPINNTSGHKGVSWNKRNKKWVAKVYKNKTCHFLGYFDSPIEAAIAYDHAAKELHGEFARLNFNSEFGRLSPSLDN